MNVINEVNELVTSYTKNELMFKLLHKLKKEKGDSDTGRYSLDEVQDFLKREMEKIALVAEMMERHKTEDEELRKKLKI